LTSKAGDLAAVSQAAELEAMAYDLERMVLDGDEKRAAVGGAIRGRIDLVVVVVDD
jgi:hypothetical protein